MTTTSTYRVTAIAAVTLALFSVGCQPWRPVTQPAPEFLRQHHPSEARLTLADGQRVEIVHPRILAGSDSTGGTVIGAVAEEADSIPAGAIRGLEVRSWSSGSKFAFGTVVGVSALVVLSYCSAFGC